MIGEVEVENLKAIMDVSLSLPLPPLPPFLFLPTRATRPYPRRPPRRLLFLLVLVFAFHLTLALVPRR